MRKMVVLVLLTLLASVSQAEGFSYDKVFHFGLMQRHLWDEGKAFYVERIRSGCQRSINGGIYAAGCIFPATHPLIVELNAVDGELRKAQGQFSLGMGKLQLAPGAATQKEVEKAVSDLSAQLVKALEFLGSKGAVMDSDRGWRWMSNRFVSE